MICKKCGKEIRDDAIFCPNCGKQIPTGQIREGAQNKKMRKGHKKGMVALFLFVILFLAGIIALFIFIKFKEMQQSGYSNEKDISVETESREETEDFVESETESEAESEPEDETAIYKAYYEKMKELQQTYGKGIVAEFPINENEADSGWTGRYLEGLCFAKLQDFNEDGQEELITAYLNRGNESYENASGITDYVVEVWKYQDFVCKKIYEGTLYIPHQGLMDEAILITSVDGVPYFVQGNDDIVYDFWGYGTEEFIKIKTLENDWIEQTGYKIDNKRVSEKEYNEEFAKWWKNCETYQVVDFSNPSIQENEIPLASEKLAAAGKLEDTLSKLKETFTLLAEKTGIETEQETQVREKQSETADSVETESAETAMTIQQVNMSCISSAEATSELSEPSVTHSVERICDGDLSTAWVEGVSGQGIGESVTIRFDDVYGIDGVRIYGGYQKSLDLYDKNSRPKEIEVEFSDGSVSKCHLEDFYGEQVIKLPSTKETSWLKITIKEVYAGHKYEDTCISEIEVY